MARAAIVIAGVFAVSLLAFNNCGGFSGPAARFKSLAASCMTGQKAQNAAVAQYDITETCEDHANYQCDIREFKPGIGNSTEVVQSCLATQIGEICLPVSISKYDTSPNRSISELDANAFSSGGEFNRSEASCFNTKVMAEGQAVFTADAPGPELALRAVIAKCRERTP